LPEGITDVKDVNNSLSPYIGIWEGVHNRNTITFTVVKITLPFGPPSNIIKDKLIVNIKIVLATNITIIDTSTMPDQDNPRFIGSEINSIAYSGYCYYTENGDYLCNTSGVFF
jgi:hypothetical protein